MGQSELRHPLAVQETHRTLEGVLADAREEAAILRRNGHPAQADGLERLAASVARVAEPWMRWLSEDDAHTKSGRSVRWLRAQAPQWEALDPPMARRDGKRWLFRDAVIPQRQHISAAREDARRHARKDAA